MRKYFTSDDARNLINVYGFSIFPVHGVKEDGSCTCGNPDCTNIGKHPATPDGFKSASNNIEEVKRLWAGRQGLNVGIATGEKSGVFVIDCDTKEAYNKIKDKLPNSLTVQTGRGYHIYFKWDKDHPVKNKTNIIDHIDIRGNGGYVIGPLSYHQSGNQYQFVNPLEEIAVSNENIYDLLTPKPLVVPKQQHIKLYTSTDGWVEGDIIDHLNHISPDVDYDTWLSIGMALHSEGTPITIWDNWSQKGTKYKGIKNLESHWKSFKGSGISYGTVVALAKQGGWTPNTKPLPSYSDLKQIEPRTEPPEEPQHNTPETHKPNPRGLFYVKGSNITYNKTDLSLVKDVMNQGELSVVYGESNCGKTFFMTDLSLHITRGVNWRDKRTTQGSVMYVALEGASGLSKRFEAYCKYHGVQKDMPFAIMPCGLDFYSDNTNITEFIDLVKQAQDDMGDLKLVVIDTLSRAMAGGDENSGQDMGKLVHYADMIRAETDAHLSFIHHSGKDKALGARGHSSLRAAVDTEIEISRSECESYSSIKFVKQREMEMIEPLAFKLENITIGTNDFNEEVTSCVVRPFEKEEITENNTPLTPKEAFVLEAIVAAIDKVGVTKIPIKGMEPVKCITFTDFAEKLEGMGYDKMYNKDEENTAMKATKEVRISLRSKNRIGFNRGFIWLLSH